MLCHIIQVGEVCVIEQQVYTSCVCDEGVCERERRAYNPSRWGVCATMKEKKENLKGAVILYVYVRNDEGK